MRRGVSGILRAQTGVPVTEANQGTGTLARGWRYHPRMGDGLPISSESTWHCIYSD